MTQIPMLRSGWRHKRERTETRPRPPRSKKPSGPPEAVVKAVAEVLDEAEAEAEA